MEANYNKCVTFNFIRTNLFIQPKFVNYHKATASSSCNCNYQLGNY